LSNFRYGELEVRPMLGGKAVKAKTAKSTGRRAGPSRVAFVLADGTEIPVIKRSSDRLPPARKLRKIVTEVKRELSQSAKANEL
jgi:hypothetical protein